MACAAVVLKRFTNERLNPKPAEILGGRLESYGRIAQQCCIHGGQEACQISACGGTYAGRIAS
jgi:hypothetical protein